MLLLVGMSKKIQTKIQNQPNIFLHPDHAFQSKVLMSASINIRKREKSIDVFFIAVKCPVLNEQKDLRKLTLFRNSVTYENL